MDGYELRYDRERSILLCSSITNNNRKLWVKKLKEISYISNIIEDEQRYYLACESGEISGQFLVLLKRTGSTKWFIPGKSYLQILFGDYIYLIFIDEEEHYYFLKVNRKSGELKWHHKVDQDLCKYSITKERILLTYFSGKEESISVKTGGFYFNDS
ncbi:MAG: hypothetical protein SVR08_00910 [Spirochaetota bacterium]|nr:hypothetical protein [Spirochaetota bacterium]